MTLVIWRFVTIMLTALAMSAALAHWMELAPKMTYDARLYVMLHRTMYLNFGRIAGIGEFLAVVGTIGLAWGVRQRPEAFAATVVAAILMAIVHAAYWIFVQPANNAMASWPLDQIPEGWQQWRDRWEYSHATRAFLLIGAFGALIVSVLREAR